MKHKRRRQGGTEVHVLILGPPPGRQGNQRPAQASGLRQVAISLPGLESLRSAGDGAACTHRGASHTAGGADIGAGHQKSSLAIGFKNLNKFYTL